MKIALIGIRGIPVVYSGFETFAEQLALGLTRKGHKITAYCRPSYIDSFKKNYKGINLIILPSINSKNFDTFSHSFISTLHACFADYDAIFYLGVGSSLFSWIGRIFGKKTLVHVDGLDWKREKWGFFARNFLKLSEYFAVIFPNCTVTDSSFVKQYYADKFGKEITCITYGGFNGALSSKKNLLKKYALVDKNYFVWNGRLVPENRVEDLVLAFKPIQTAFKCVILGDDPYGNDYKAKLVQLTKDDKRFVFTGFVSRSEAARLVASSYTYIETKRSGGTHPSLVEAMGLGAIIIANNFKSTRETLGQSAIYYNIKAGFADLEKKIKLTLEPGFWKEGRKIKETIAKRYKANFDWKRVIGEYEDLFKSLFSEQ